MNARKITKIVAGQMTDFTMGSIANGVARQHRTVTNVPALNVVIGVSTFVGGWMLGETIAAPVHKKSDEYIDRIFDIFEQKS